MRARWIAGVVGLGLLAAACGGGDDDDASTAPASTEARESAAGGTAITVDQAAPSPAEDVPSALDDPDDDSFPEPLINTADLLSGGPPPDGIPAIDKPKFLAPDQVDFVEDQEPVMALEIGDDARAYPLQVMTWHEIVNDTVDGVPVAVTYCPLCNTAIAYDRRLGDRVLDFGTSGMLYNSALVMYDRQTESLWSHFTAQAIVGHLAGQELDVYPVAIVAWADWRDAHPDGLVLSRDTGHDRDYGRNPYPGYDDIDSPAFLFEGEVDGRLAAKERVIGIERDGDAVAVRADELAEAGVIEVEVGGDTLIVWLDPGTASALDSPALAEGRDVGATGVFAPVVDGRALTFERADDGFLDDQTGSRWNALGDAVEGPLTGRALEPVVHVDTFWFAWGAFQPDTRIVP
ncbi:MAG TPA: DUF3179 domain-containing protein [Acidimicrobiales bacterium]|jgi:hypothetical protein|nr:DUF3179 domain-containing protein [Acidimicrobiales bacterium]